MNKKSPLSAFLAAILIGGLVLASAMCFGTVQAASASDASLPTLLWQKTFGFPAGTKDNYRDWSSPTVVDGILYIGANTVINSFQYYSNPPPYGIWWDFYAFNASNGVLIWDYRGNNASFIETSCAVANGAVFFGIGTLNTGSVFALNASSGTLLWNYTTNKGLSSLTVANDIVYFTVGYYGYTLYALNATSGNKILELSGYGRSSPKIVNGILYIGSQDDYNLNALNASNGKPIWNYTTEFYVYSTPAVAGGSVYFSSGDNIYALDARTGVKLWNYSTAGDGYESSSPTFWNGIVYIFSSREQNLIALKASNGVKLWNYTKVGGNPIVANGVVHVSVPPTDVSSGYLFALNAYNGEKIWSYSIPPIPPLYNWYKIAVTNDALYFGVGTSLYALKLPPSPSVSSPPTIVSALTDEGQLVNLTISGNVTSSQISNVYITSDQSTSTVYLTVTGVSGTIGFSNMTIQKGLICNETIPTIYIDDQIAKKQGYTQDSDNYYVWYTTDFSTHQISIIFSESQNLKTSSLPDYIIWLGAASAVVAVSAGVGLLVYFKKRKTRIPYS